MEKKTYRKQTPEERARWQANQDRLEAVLEQALRGLGESREELEQKVGLPPTLRRNG